MVVRELLCRLGFETDEKKVNSFENSIGNLTKGLGYLVTAATAAKTAALGLVYSTAAYSDEIARSSKLANTSIQDFQELAVASQTVGIEQDKLADILKDVNDKMGDYAQTGGGAMADFFEFIAPKIGVTAQQFKNLSGSDALQLYVSSLEKANLSQADMTFYMEAIASDSTLLLPLLEKNGEAYKALAKEAGEYGAILSEETIEQNRKFTKELKSLDNMVDGVRRTIGNQLIPVFNEIIKDFKEFIGKNRELIQIRIKDFIEGAIWVVKQFIGVLSTVFGWIDKVAQKLGGWENAMKIVAAGILVITSIKLYAWLMGIAVAAKAAGISLGVLAAGTALGLGMIAGIVALGTAIVLLIEDMYQWVQGNESVVGDLIATWFEFVTKIKGYLSEGVEYIKTKFSEISTSISDSFNSATESVKGYFKGLFDDVTAFVDKIIGVFTSLKDKVSNIFGSVKDSIKSGLNAVLPESVATSLGINTNSEDNQKEANIVNNLTEQQKQEIYNKINLDDSLVNSIRPQSETITPTAPSVLGSTNNTSSVVNDNKTINITVPPGTTAEQVEAVKQQINKTMQQQYTDAAQHLEGY